MLIVKEYEASKAKLSIEWNYLENNDKVQYADIGLRNIIKKQVVSTATQNRSEVSLGNADIV